jgi:hypothetical protein
MHSDYGDPSLLIGRTLESVEVRGDKEEMFFVCTDGEAFRAYHMQDCCESVSIHDVSGNPSDLVGSPVVEASEMTSFDWPHDVLEPKYLPDSFTWTTHRFKTQSGVEVVVRWLGESNSYYGEGVYFQRTHKPIDGFVA